MEKKSKKRDAKRTRAKLLKTAEKVFVKKGFDGTRVDEIANQAGINKRMIYLYFGNKEQLYVAVLKNSFEKLFNSTPPMMNEQNDPLDDVRDAIKWYFWFLHDNPNYVRLFNWETLTNGSRAGKVMFELMDVGLGPLQQMLKRGKEKGVLKEDISVHKIVTVVHEICIGFFSRQRFFEILWKRDLKSKENLDDMLDHVLKIVLEGITL